MTFSAIIQARTGSTRLPNKVLLKLCDKSVLEHVIERVGEAKNINRIIVITTHKNNDDVIAKLCRSLSIGCFRGSENDVLDSYYQTARLFKVDNIIRITADCPLIDPDLIDQVVNLYRKEKLLYATNSFPPTFPDGLNVEIFPFRALKEAWLKTNLNSEREHVTPYFWRNPHLFKQKHITCDTNYSNHRWTLDNPEDYKFIKEIFTNLYPLNPKFRMKDVLEFLHLHPDLIKINSHIQRDEGLAKSIKEDKKNNIKLTFS